MALNKPTNPVAGTETNTPAIVTFGTVNFSDSGGTKYQDFDDGLYTDYTIRNNYENDKKIYMMGVTSPSGFQGKSVAFTQLAAPTLLWISDWTALRIGKQPEIPNPASNDPNWILLDEMLEPASISLAPDGVNPIYRISGTYVYGHLNPNADVFKNINYGRPPWLIDVFDRTQPDSLLLQNLSNGTGGGSSAGTGLGPAVAPGAPGKVGN